MRGDGGNPGLTYAATLRWTSHAIPHITARDYASLGYGFGYALARENLCVLAEAFVTVNAQRSRFFGPEAFYENRVRRVPVNNLKSDYFFQAIKDARTVEELLARQPPLGPSEKLRAITRGYAAGYNRYLRETGVDKLPDARCRGAAWVRPITELDLYRRYYQLSLLASSGFLLDELVSAQPPEDTFSGAVPAGGSGPLTVDRSALPIPENLGIGSNAIALGSEATANGRGMLLGNPHFPWYGPERLYQVHLTIPGELNVSGVTLLGAPVVLIGHNEHLAWSHTVSTAFRFTPYELKLVPGDPMAYMYEGGQRRMTAQTVTVQALEEDGALEPRTHTFYRTHFGPMIQYPGALLYWTAETGYAIRDANATNLRAFDQFLAMNRARSLEELRQVQDLYQGLPWVSTTATDRHGNTYYADASVVPHVTDEKIDQCVVSPVGRAVYQAARLPVLDGSREECEWGKDEDAVEPGLFGPKVLPRLLRKDYVGNFSDSPWLANPRQPLTGYPRIIGDEGTARGLRTRLGWVMVEQRLAGTDGLAGKGFTLDQLQERVLNNRNHSAELLRDDAVRMCQRTTRVVMPDGTLVDVQQALGAAVQELLKRDIPLDVTLRTQQVSRLGGEAIPIHGCNNMEGCLNYILARWEGCKAYEVVYGSGLVLAVSFTEAGPVARSILSYSQSSNPDSPHAVDQTRMFSEKKWVNLRFTEREIASDPDLTLMRLSE